MLLIWLCRTTILRTVVGVDALVVDVVEDVVFKVQVFVTISVECPKRTGCHPGDLRNMPQTTRTTPRPAARIARITEKMIVVKKPAELTANQLP